MLGYSNIPASWMKNLHEVENMNFAYTDISLNETYEMSLKLALKVIERNGGTVENNQVTIPCEQPVPVAYELAFEGLYPVKSMSLNKSITEIAEIEFEGTGIVFKGRLRCPDEKYVAEVTMHIDGKIVETAEFPASYRTRRNDLFWKYDLIAGKHKAEFKWLNPVANAELTFGNVIIYNKAPLKINN
jgi:hypothetical protein